MFSVSSSLKLPDLVSADLRPLAGKLESSRNFYSKEIFQVKLLTLQFTPVFIRLLCFVCHLFHNFAACYIIVVEYSYIYVRMYTYIWQSNIYANVINERYVTWVAAAWTDVPVATRKSDRGLGQILHDQLHWLDVPDRVLFKLAVTVHQCLNGRAPPYLSEHCIPVSSADTRRHLRSANRHLLAIPRFQLNTYGRRVFSVAGTHSRILSWIQRAAQTVFRRQLKTYYIARY